MFQKYKFKGSDGNGGTFEGITHHKYSSMELALKEIELRVHSVIWCGVEDSKDKALKLEKIMTNAGQIYKGLKIAKKPFQDPDLFTEVIPSDQIRALAAALVDELL